jgi:hypothetical protein
MATIADQIKKLKDRIAADTAKVQELEAADKAQGFITNLQAGDIVQFVFGRKDNRKTHTGEVRAIIDTDKGKVIRVIKGEGAEEEIVSIRPGDITGVGEDVQEADASAEETAAQAANGDPLANLV